MGVISRQVLPFCGSLCFFCPSVRARSRQPVKRYKKLLADIFPKSQVWSLLRFTFTPVLFEFIIYELTKCICWSADISFVTQFFANIIYLIDWDCCGFGRRRSLMIGILVNYALTHPKTLFAFLRYVILRYIDAVSACLICS